MAAPILCRKLERLMYNGLLLKYRLSYRHYSTIKKTVHEIIQNRCKIDESRVEIEGWLKSVKKQKHNTFLHVTDGTCTDHVQVVADPSLTNKDLNYGSSVRVEGCVVESIGPGQAVEVQASHIDHVGGCDVTDYPLKYKANLSLDQVRHHIHLRPRTSHHAATLRVRNAATMAVHKFFQDEGYMYIHTPIITSNDCEGAGETFHVQTSSEVEESLQKKGEITRDSSASGVTAPDKDGPGNIKQLFFGHPVYLTVSGQLHLEAVTGAFKKAYSFGPTFRAEKSLGRHHLAEFYMIEAELAFVNHLETLLEVMERLVKSVTEQVLTNHSSDVGLLWKSGPKNMEDTVDTIKNKPFIRMTYAEAISMLQKNTKKFNFEPKYGCDLQKEHEKYLVSSCDNTPVFVTDFPGTLKPFYAKQNDDSATVAAVDLLVPEVGELFGGSLREHRYQVLKSRLDQLGMSQSYDWYLDLRRYGSVPHGGFGMGFERYLQCILGIGNIKDTIPFPRWVSKCDV